MTTAVEAENFLAGHDPLTFFKSWLADAQSSQLKFPEAFVLSTVSTEGRPSSRVVLLKEFRPDGFVFYTNYESHKGRELTANPNFSANFYWDPLARQVIWHGTAEKLSPEESATYWATRPRASQLSQFVSKQSRPVCDRSQMESEWFQAERDFAHKDVPLPKNWGGFLLKPTYVEFWIGREGRFHDRYVYKLENRRWTGERYYP